MGVSVPFAAKVQVRATREANVKVNINDLKVLDLPHHTVRGLRSVR